MEEHVLIHVVGDLGQVGVVLLTQLQDGDLHVLAERLHELGVQLLAAFLAERKQQALVVEGNRHERAVDVGEHLVLVIGPLGEAGQERVHALAEGVVDVRTVHVNKHTGLIQVVVGVAGDVVAALEDGDAEADGLGEATGAHRTRIARTDDDHVVGARVEILRET